MFGWLTRRVRDAFVAGIAEGVARVTRVDDGASEAHVVDQLRLTLIEPRAALPTTAETEPAARTKRRA